MSLNAWVIASLPAAGQVAEERLIFRRFVRGASIAAGSRRWGNRLRRPHSRPRHLAQDVLVRLRGRRKVFAWLGGPPPGVRGGGGGGELLEELLALGALQGKEFGDIAADGGAGGGLPGGGGALDDVHEERLEALAGDAGA